MNLAVVAGMSEKRAGQLTWCLAVNEAAILKLGCCQILSRTPFLKDYVQRSIGRHTVWKPGIFRYAPDLV